MIFAVSHLKVILIAGRTGAVEIPRISYPSVESRPMKAILKLKSDLPILMEMVGLITLRSRQVARRFGVGEMVLSDLDHQDIGSYFTGIMRVYANLYRSRYQMKASSL